MLQLLRDLLLKKIGLLERCGLHQTLGYRLRRVIASLDWRDLAILDEFSVKDRLPRSLRLDWIKLLLSRFTVDHA